MVFADLFFLFVFLPLFVLLYAAAGVIDRQMSRKAAVSVVAVDGVHGNLQCEGMQSKTHIVRNSVLVFFSLLFYAWGEPVYIMLMLLSVMINYGVGMAVFTADDKKRRKVWLVAGVAVNLLILGSFKYLEFFADIFRWFGLDVTVPHITLPIGISFYIFQSISYLVDVYRGDAPVQRSYWGLLLYISMFPQLIAGPIVRYSTVAREIHSRHVTSEDIADGVFRFLIGLGKKVLLANQLGEIATKMLAGGMTGTSVAGAWIGVIAFTLQLYFDFSGYTDMAIGIGRCLGFRFCENFDHPFCSRTITEFWRRWHISMGSFFRDYVYIPLGGNRRHQLLNIMAVWMLTGLWHGASWNFVLWGLYYGILLLIEKNTILRIKDKIPAALLSFYTIVIVLIGNGIFYFYDLGSLGHFFSVAFGLTDAPAFTFEDKTVLFERFWLLLVALVVCLPVRPAVSNVSKKVFRKVEGGHDTAVLVTRFAVSAVILILSVALLVGATNNAFLYTRF